VSKLFSVECGVLEEPNFTRILHCVITIAETEEQALQYARRHYPDIFAACPEHRVVKMKHMIIDYCTSETVIEASRTKEFHC